MGTPVASLAPAPRPRIEMQNLFESRARDVYGMGIEGPMARSHGLTAGASGSPVPQFYSAPAREVYKEWWQRVSPIIEDSALGQLLKQGILYSFASGQEHLLRLANAPQ